MKKVFLSFTVCLFILRLNAQIIPDSMRVDWTHAGLEGTIPDPQTVLNVIDYGAIPDDSGDDLSAVMLAMNALNGQAGVVYFPSGTYNLDSTINLFDSIVLRGAGSDSTTLQFDFNS